MSKKTEGEMPENFDDDPINHGRRKRTDEVGKGTGRYSSDFGERETSDDVGMSGYNGI